MVALIHARSILVSLKDYTWNLPSSVELATHPYLLLRKVRPNQSEARSYEDPKVIDGK